MKRQGSIAKKCCNYKILLNKKIGEDKRRQENGQTQLFFPFQNCSFWAYIKEINTLIIFMHGHSSWSIFRLHLVRSPKAL